jgi:DNA polymerase-3 subunit epsilon
VNPQCRFDPFNSSIHGIDELKVRDAPTWDAAFHQISPALRDKVIVSHTAFDRISILRSCENYRLPLITSDWLDTAKVVRRAWPQFSKAGFGLANVAQHLGIFFQAHDALEDARCAGEILLKAIECTGLSLEMWLDRVRRPIHSINQSVARVGNPEGPLHGEVIVFTGALSITRHQAANAAAFAGCEVSVSITKRTTLLVVGNQDLSRLAGKEKSSKHVQAEVLISKGQKLRILGESDFLQIVDDTRLNSPGSIEIRSASSCTGSNDARP